MKKLIRQNTPKSKGNKENFFGNSNKTGIDYCGNDGEAYSKKCLANSENQNTKSSPYHLYFWDIDDVLERAWESICSRNLASDGDNSEIVGFNEIAPHGEGEFTQQKYEPISNTCNNDDGCNTQFEFKFNEMARFNQASDIIDLKTSNEYADSMGSLKCKSSQYLEYQKKKNPTVYSKKKMQSPNGNIDRLNTVTAVSAMTENIGDKRKELQKHFRNSSKHRTRSSGSNCSDITVKASTHKHNKTPKK